MIIGFHSFWILIVYEKGGKFKNFDFKFLYNLHLLKVAETEKRELRS